MRARANSPLRQRQVACLFSIGRLLDQTIGH
jgi:hypothetical protein